MRPAKNKSNERPTREEMQKKRQEIDAKIKSILTDEQYKKYQDMRKKDNAKKQKKANCNIPFLYTDGHPKQTRLCTND